MRLPDRLRLLVAAAAGQLLHESAPGDQGRLLQRPAPPVTQSTRSPDQLVVTLALSGSQAGRQTAPRLAVEAERPVPRAGALAHGVRAPQDLERPEHPSSAAERADREATRTPLMIAHVKAEPRSLPGIALRYT